MKTLAKKSRDKNQENKLVELQSEVENLRTRVAAMEKNEQRLAALTEISALISQSTEFRDMLNLTADRLMKILNADAVRVYLLEEDTGELVLGLHKGLSAGFITNVKIIKNGEGFNGIVVTSGEPLVIANVADNSMIKRQVLVDEGIQSQLIVPLKSKRKVIGTLCIAKRKPANFSRDDLELLSSIGNHIGANLENMLLYQDMKRALSQLQQSEERYRDLFESASDAIWVHDFNNRTLAVNKACQQVTGYSSAELMGVNICQLLSPKDRALIGEIEGRLLRGEPV